MSDLLSKSALASAIALLLVSCSSTPGTRTADEVEETPIENPFGNVNAKGNSDEASNITVRSRSGDRSFEVDIPKDQNGEVSVPMNSRLSQMGVVNAMGERADNGVDYTYSKAKPSYADREIASTFTSSQDPETAAKKREIESSLGLQGSADGMGVDESYLAKVDVIKQLFKNGRYEAALIETDRLIKLYPTSGAVYEMRGTLLDRLGYADLALKSWHQALEFEPNKLSLKKLIEKREIQRSVASQKQ